MDSTSGLGTENNMKIFSLPNLARLEYQWVQFFRFKESIQTNKRTV